MSAPDLVALLREAGAALVAASVRPDLVDAIDRAVGEVETQRTDLAEAQRKLALATQLRINMAATVDDEAQRRQRAEQMEQVHDLLRKRDALPAAEIVRALPILGHELQAEALLQDFVDRGWLDAWKDGPRPPRLRLGLVRTWLIDLDGQEGEP